MSEFITDRTEYDVAVAQDFFTAFWDKLDGDEQLQWMGGLKGCFNYTDYNRLAQIVASLTGAGFNLIDMETMPVKTDIERLFSNIAIARDITYGITERDYVDYRSCGTDYDTTANKLHFERLNYLEAGLQLAEQVSQGQAEMPIDFDLIDSDLNDIHYELDGILTATADGQNFNIFCPKGYEIKVTKGQRNHKTWITSQVTTYEQTTDGYGQSFISSSDNYYMYRWFSIEIRPLAGYSIYDLDTSKIKVLLH